MKKAVIFFKPRGVFLAGVVVLLSWLSACTVLRSVQPQYRSTGEGQGVKIAAPADAMISLPLNQLRSFGYGEADTEQWVLSFRGVQIPYWILKAHQLVFYSPPTKSEYWEENTFLFQPRSRFISNPDPQLLTLLQTPQLPAPSFLEQQPAQTVLTYHKIEEDQVYQSQAEGDHWLWEKLVNSQQKRIAVPFADVPAGDVFVRMVIFSTTEAPTAPDHRLQISVNDQFLEEIAWDGKGLQSIEKVLPGKVFREGENLVSLSIPEIEGVFAQVSYLDKLEIFSWQRIPFQAKQLRFYANRAVDFGLVERKGEAIRVYDLNDFLNPKEFKIGEDEFPEGGLKPYLWVTEDGFRQPTELRAIVEDQPSPEEQTQDIEYLAIGQRDLLEPLQPLLELRQQQGLSVAAKSVEEIYDQFYGFAEPQAIRHYLMNSLRENPSLKYVLLVGDATYDPSGKVSRVENNRLPTYFIETIFGGQTSSELPFALLDDQNYDPETLPIFQPQVAVGRVPASSARQIQAWVSKVLEYEKGNKKPARDAVLAIADPYEDYFGRDAEAFAALWGDTIEEEIYLPQSGESDLENKIRNYFQQDYSLIAYFGHGAIDLWGKDEIFSAKEAQKLVEQASYPLVLNFTCLTGYYIHPEAISLTEALLWNPDGGTIFVIAPTSLTLADDQSFFWKAFVESYLLAGEGRIGDIWMATFPKIPLTSAGVRDVVATYTFFGDPATTLP